MIELQRRLDFLTSVVEGILASVELDEILYVIMCGITSGEGLGFHRAFVFLLDESERTLTCKMAVGPASEREAHRIWEEMEARAIDLPGLLRSYRSSRHDPGAWRLMRRLSGLAVPGRRLALRPRPPRGRLPAALSLERLVLRCLCARAPLVDNRCRVTFRPPGGGRPLEFRRFAVVPLHRGRDVVGAILADNVFAGGREVDVQDVESLRGVSNLVTLAIDRARLYERMRRLAELDGLTGLLNRRIYDEQLGRLLDESVRRGEPLSLVLLDLDNFKPINDRCGHPVGDDVLREVGRVLRSGLRAGDLSVRYGGDEFAVVLARTRTADALRVAQKLCRRVRAIRLSRVPGLRVSVSAGVACSVQGFVEPEALTAAADAALYRAKRDGRDRAATASGPPRRRRSGG
ncbi:MAG: sensor domain-containing diguanylate cyclase [Deltaproteobacteria bacterium]|nr:sensor domain-containing diguanylate cyclase [Deltaproteobacteria bacterium]